jgi:hypothetical protein
MRRIEGVWLAGDSKSLDTHGIHKKSANFKIEHDETRIIPAFSNHKVVLEFVNKTRRFVIIVELFISKFVQNVVGGSLKQFSLSLSAFYWTIALP